MSGHGVFVDTLMTTCGFFNTRNCHERRFFNSTGRRKSELGRFVVGTMAYVHRPPLFTVFSNQLKTMTANVCSVDQTRANGTEQSQHRRRRQHRPGITGKPTRKTLALVPGPPMSRGTFPRYKTVRGQCAAIQSRGIPLCISKSLAACGFWPCSRTGP